jgi:hypothetical protein
LGAGDFFWKEPKKQSREVPQGAGKAPSGWPSERRASEPRRRGWHEEKNRSLMGELAVDAQDSK